MEDPTTPETTKDQAAPRRPRPRPGSPALPPGENVDKQVRRIVAEGDLGDVHKRTLGDRFKDLIAEIDVKGALGYVLHDVMVPAARNVIVSSVTNGIERIVYPDAPAPGQRIYRPGVGQRPTGYSAYGYRPGATRPPTGRTIDTTVRNQRSQSREVDAYVITNRKVAEEVVEELGNVLDMYGVVTIADLNETLGVPSVHTDHKFGWDTLRGAEVRPVPDGYIITLGPAEPIT